MFRIFTQAARAGARGPFRLFGGARSVSRTYKAGGALLGAGLVSYSSAIRLEKETKVAAEIDSTINVDLSISPFPVKISLKEHPHVVENYTLLGYGVRSVTFVGFKVYGIGVYICDGDVRKAKELLSREYLASFGTENHSLGEFLNNKEVSPEIVNRLLENDVRFLIRISPVRNTDFNHMKDGLVKSILASEKAKQLREIVGSGLEELRDVFQKTRGSVPKNHLLWMEVLNGGKLKVTYENTASASVRELGVVNEPVISNILMLQYLSGSKPLSEPLRKSCVDGFVGL